MSAEEDTELRDLIIQTLENNGIIGKIKAELRASVFLALEEEGSFSDKIPLVNKRLTEFITSPEGKVVVSLVREFLQFFNLNFSLAVFDPEVLASADYFSRTELCNQLKLNDKMDTPLLADIIRRNQQDSSTNERNILLESTFTKEETFKGSKESINNVTLSNPVAVAKSTVDIPVLDYNKPSEVNDFNDSDDPFFDEPVPQEKRSFFSLSKEKEQLPPKSTTNKPSSNSTNPYVSKSDGKAADRNSLTSLKDLPSLNAGNSGLSDWTTNKGQGKKLPSLSFDIHGEEYDDEDFHSSGSGQSAKSSQKSVDNGNQVNRHDQVDNQDISEQSIEEDIDEDSSVAADDLLNSSLSLGDDVTTDQTISQLSGIGGYDYMESCGSKK